MTWIDKHKKGFRVVWPDSSERRHKKALPTRFAGHLIVKSLGGQKDRQQPAATFWDRTGGPCLVRELAKAWLAHFSATKQESTQVKANATRLPHIEREVGTLDVRRVNDARLNVFVSALLEKPLGGATVAGMVSTLRMLINAAKNSGLVRNDELPRLQWHETITNLDRSDKDGETRRVGGQTCRKCPLEIDPPDPDFSDDVHLFFPIGLYGVPACRVSPTF